MKYRKQTRFFSALLALALLLILAPQLVLSAAASATTGKCGETLTWSFDEATGTLTVSGSGAMFDTEPSWEEFDGSIRFVSLPSGLSNIAADAFSGCDKLESVTIPEGVRIIEEAAFADCAVLKRVIFPNSLQVIGHAAFSRCIALTQVSIPEGVQTIEFDTFRDCVGLAQVSIPTTVTLIGQRAFEGCRSLKSISIPGQGIRIEESAFHDCDALKSISISGNVAAIGHEVFSGTGYYSNRKNWTDSLLYLGNWLIASREDITKAEIQPGTVGIADQTFESRKSLTSVAFPDGLTYIGSWAFSGCEELADIRLPGSVSHIGRYAFNNTRYYNDPYNWSGPVLYLGDWLIAYDYFTPEVRIRPGVRAIADSVFDQCESLIRVKLPETVTSIGDSAFERTGLTELVIPSGMKTIGHYAFEACERLSSLTLADSLVSIGHDAFSVCRSLTEVTIPESVASIGEGAFGLCDSLRNVLLLSRDCAIGDGAQTLGDARTTVVIGYSSSTAETYAKAYDFSFRDYEKYPFLDVDESDYFAEPIAWAVKENITNGTAPLSFSPAAICTRAQAVTFLWRAAGCPKPNGADSPFADVMSDQYYYDAVLWAVEEGITSGTSVDKFSPDSGCTRAQVVTFLWRSKSNPSPESSDNPFTDVLSEAYYSKAAAWAVEKDITKGTSTGKFSPDVICTRGQIVTFLYRNMRG